jgi:hypothetical protein
MTDHAWTAPLTERVRPPNVAPEREALERWLDYHRQTLLTKCAGLTGEQLSLRSIPPSSLSLLGLVRHMTEVERSWFRVRLGGLEPDPLYYSDDNPDGDFDDVDPAAAETDFATYLAEVEVVRQAVAGRDLDDRFEGRLHQLDLRWAMLHMIEEYARHNGHADLLRECIDGVTGE